MMSESRSDLLVSLIAADEASSSDWQEFEALAAEDPRLWQELATAQHQQASLTRAVGTLAAVADQVDLPGRAMPVSAPVVETSGTARSILYSFAGWGGWALAAVLTLVVGLQFFGGIESPVVEQKPVATHTPDVVPAAIEPTSAETLPLVDGTAQLASMDDPDVQDVINDLRQVVGEMPTKVLLDVRPRREGDGWELLYLRPVLERRQVPELYRLDGHNERGQPSLVRWEKPPGGAPM